MKNRAKEITITHVMNGYKVRVGCQELAFHDPSVLIHELRNYLENPDAVERAYVERFGLGIPMPVTPPTHLPGEGRRISNESGATIAQAPEPDYPHPICAPARPS